MYDLDLSRFDYHLFRLLQEKLGNITLSNDHSKTFDYEISKKITELHSITSPCSSVILRIYLVKFEHICYAPEKKSANDFISHKHFCKKTICN